jgi:circadian clock protein KaiB
MRDPANFEFSLYVAGETQNSVQATSNLARLCQASLPGHHSIEIIDVFKDPQRALADGVFMTPTLIKRWPLPVRRIVGTLSQTEIVVQALGLHALAE